ESTPHGRQLVAVSETGTVKTAPWQLVSEAFDIATLPTSEKVTVAPPATDCETPVAFVNVTPVEALHAAPLSEVIGPAAVTAVTATRKGLGWVTFRTGSRVPPG